jgi:hypothetical protein
MNPDRPLIVSHPGQTQDILLDLDRFPVNQKTAFVLAKKKL